MTRRPDIDALRVGATVAVFLFHCAKFFDPGGWHLTNAPSSKAVGAGIDFTALWLMPLFFVLSGTSTAMALARRSVPKLVTDRVLRLLLPFAFGVLVIVPPQVWVERMGQRAFVGSYWAFYPHYFEGMYGFGGNFGWMGLHLWYLLLLFLITVLLSPVLRLLATRVVDSPWVLLAPVIVMAALEVALIGRPLDNRGLGGWSILQYPFFFAFGVVLSDGSRARATVRRFAIPLLVVGALLGGAWAFAPKEIVALAPRAVWRIARVAGSWGMLFGILGLAETHLRDARWLGPLNEASMPFYVFHQTVVLLIAFVLAGWGTSIATKYLVLASTAFVSTAAITWMALRIDLLRPLIGLKRVARRRAA